MTGLTELASEISDALTRGRQGCILCSFWSQEEASIVERLGAQGDSNSALLEGLQASSGFCNRHTHAVHKDRSSSSLGSPAACSACARIVLRKFEGDLGPILSELKTGKSLPESGRRKKKEKDGEEFLAGTTAKLEESISGAALCPVCERLLESDRDRLAGLLALLESREHSELYARSEALCMPHFVSAMQMLPKFPIKAVEGVWGLLTRTQLARLESIDHLLNERMKKYSWDYRNEGMTPEEANAQKTAMLAIAGVEGLYCRPRKTSLRPARVWH